MIDQAKQVAQRLREGDYPLMSQVISTIDALVTYAAESEKRLLDTIQEKHLLETEVDRLRLKLDASTSRRETLRYQRDAAQAEVERITGEWAALSQDQGKAEREIDRLRAEVERLTKVDVEPMCNQHPDAPHGFDRNGSHNAGRYVCECEGWTAPEKVDVEPCAWRDPTNINPGQGCTYDKAVVEKWPHIYSQPLVPATALAAEQAKVRELVEVLESVAAMSEEAGISRFARSAIAKCGEQK